jgi:hypothetical protein
MPSAPCARFLKEAILMMESTQTALDLPLRSFSLGESESDAIYLRGQFQLVRRDCPCEGHRTWLAPFKPVGHNEAKCSRPKYRACGRSTLRNARSFECREHKCTHEMQRRDGSKRAQ